MTLDWLASCSGSPAASRPHRGHRLHRHARRARRRARRAARAGSSSAPSTRTPPWTRRRSCSSSSCGRSRSTTLPVAAGRARPPRCLCRRGDDRDDVHRRRSTRSRRLPNAVEAGGVWLHVDAAYAGAAAICPELRDRFAGWERADSIVVNPHKWLGMPMDCSALWTRRPEEFRDAFSLVPEYLRVARRRREPERVHAAARPPLPRAEALGGAALLRPGGLQERIREHVRLAELFESWIEDEPGWEIVAPRPSRSSASAARVRTRRTSGCSSASTPRARCSSRTRGSADGFALRLAIGNYRTTEDDVRLAWDVLRREASTG